MALLTDGYLSQEEVDLLPGVPSKERLAKGPVVVVECAQHCQAHAACVEAHHRVEIGGGERRRAVAPRAARDAGEQTIDKLAHPGVNLPGRERRREQPHAAVDVVPDAAGGDDPMRDFGGSHSPDRESITLVHIRHDDHGPRQTRESGGIHRLLERFIPGDLLQQGARGEEMHLHAHSRAVGLRELPLGIGDPDQFIQAYHGSPFPGVC